eukprot:PITA_21665
MLIKFDMSNAFDRVRLSFLYKILLSFGFSANFVNFIKASTHGPWIAPLVNGRPSDFFQASRGLRQGCPLPPFLYILMAKSLSKKLTAEMEIGTIPGIKAARGVDSINHTLFADDSLLLVGASIKIGKAFKEILQHFCLITGALINKRKSLPLTLEPSPPSLWNEIISKIKAKIAYWGGQWLTKAVKLILIKAVLSALPIFQCSLLLAPKLITEQISKILRDFLGNGGKGNQRKLHLVRWNILNRPLQQGGLQIWDPGLANLTLGGKIIWQLYADKNHPVSKILLKKHLKGGSLRNLTTTSTPTGTTIWNLVRRSIDHIQQQLYKILGNGQRTLLWEDTIQGNAPLVTLNSYSDLKI